MLASATDESQVNLRSQECVNWCVSCSRASTRPLTARCSSGFKAEACITYGFHRIYMDSWWLMYKAHLHCTAYMYPHIAVWFAKLCTHYTHSWPLACPSSGEAKAACSARPTCTKVEFVQPMFSISLIILFTIKGVFDLEAKLIKILPR